MFSIISMGYKFIAPEHIAIGLLTVDDGSAGQVLQNIPKEIHLKFGLRASWRGKLAKFAAMAATTDKNKRGRDDEMQMWEKSILWKADMYLGWATQIMLTRRRSDVSSNIPSLKKLDVVKKDESEEARNRSLAGVLKGGDGESSKDFRPKDYSEQRTTYTVSVHFQLWNTECDIFQPGDILCLTNGMFTYNRDKYFVPRAGRRGKVQKVGEFTMAFEESPNMSEIVFEQASRNYFDKVITPLNHWPSHKAFCIVKGAAYNLAFTFFATLSEDLRLSIVYKVLVSCQGLWFKGSGSRAVIQASRFSGCRGFIQHQPLEMKLLQVCQIKVEILYGDVDEDGRAHAVARGELRAAFDAPAMARVLEVSRIYPQICQPEARLKINGINLSNKKDDIIIGFEPCKPFENHESHGDIPFSGPLQVSGSSGFAWARRRFDDSSSLRSCSRGRDSKPEAFDSGSDGHNSQDRSIAVFKKIDYIGNTNESNMFLKSCTTFQTMEKVMVKENSEDIFNFGRALEDFICVVFVPDRNITLQLRLIKKDKGGEVMERVFENWERPREFEYILQHIRFRANNESKMHDMARRIRACADGPTECVMYADYTVYTTGSFISKRVHSCFRRHGYVIQLEY
ncbi:SOSS complex subunit B [Tanacetum coccineum]|uniref:SOSS complex subunit B n=1 Tax=Tanacetum coccineum TaxID=301880 RepID=A0ABQ5AHM7_9ASTR